ncbi:NAD(P)H-dependent flavin oxidoreductase [Nocardioides speluncae]|uniref:NAD(P)H-dependent flavin oxidoreductase n=1 Tax=Nocardioides speluncae TaxID=2670337 RepID=UPI000D691589|nr:nitronate monooxygenase [Nocardioides speluncae]
MALTTTFTTLAGCIHPVVSAPMGGSAGGELAAAVSNAGGYGFVGGGPGQTEWLEPQLRIAAEKATRPWGAGLLTWAADDAKVGRLLEYGPASVFLGFGDPTPYADRIHAAGAQLFVQVTDLDEARQALDAGADVVIAQGVDAGGHSGGGRGTMSFVPVVVDLAGSVPVLAAGGVVDGRGLAASLALGAAGALVGTRFQACPEAVVPEAVQKALLTGGGDDTVLSTVLDAARRSAWPSRYPGRSLRNAFLDRWEGRVNELRGDEAALAEYADGVARQDRDYLAVWASAAVDLITELTPAAEIVAEIAGDAEEILTRLPG